MSIRILYVEDELFLGKIVKESLESRGFEVAMESDGIKVLPRFMELKPDICILDVMLPNKDGFEIAGEIRNLDNKIPIIFLTAKTQTGDLVKGFSIGGNDYIRKPFSMEELIVRIENAMRFGNERSKSLPVGDEVKLGRFQFHVVRQTLNFGKEERKLSFREAELLKLLYQNRNKIIERKEILNLLWGNDSFFNSRNLDVYIAKIRSYLKEDEDLDLITIKGIGYRFIID
jgi:DNA-binding response OmpR family regulator